MKNKFRLKTITAFFLLLVTVLLALQTNTGVWAGNGESPAFSQSSQMTHSVDEASQLPILQEPQVKKLTLKQATILTAWSQQVLNEQHAKVAFVARNGTRFARAFDKTGMGHGGLVVWDPAKNDWVIYQLISDKTAPDYNPKDPRAKLFVSSLLTFFSGQRTDKLEGLMLIPDLSVQEAIQQILLSGENHRFLYTDKYDFLARVNDNESLNCIKWVLTLVLAAQNHTSNLADITSRMDQVYQYPKHDLSLFQRPFLRFVPGIRLERIPRLGISDLVVTSSEGLYYLDLFPVKRFYSGRILKQ